MKNSTWQFYILCNCNILEQINECFKKNVGIIIIIKNINTQTKKKKYRKSNYNNYIKYLSIVIIKYVYNNNKKYYAL